MTTEDLATERADRPAAADPGNAPAIAAPTRTERRPRATSRVLWLVSYAAVVVLIGLRIPRTFSDLRRNMPAEMSAQIHDKDMETLALRTGLFLGVVLTALIFVLLFVASAILEKRVFAARRTLGKGLSFGLYFLVILLCVLPAQVICFAFDISTLQGKPLFLAYVGVVGLLSPFVFLRELRRSSATQIATVFITSVGLAALTSVG
jgi:hypothetical protein